MYEFGLILLSGCHARGAGTHPLAVLVQSYAIFLEYPKIIVEKIVLYLYCNSRVGLSCIMCMFRHPLPRLLNSGD